MKSENGKLHQNEEISLLKIAERHLNYILGDPDLSLNSRVYRANKTIEFYSGLLKNLGMLSVLSRWQKSSVKQMVGSSVQLYPLSEVFDVVGISQNNEAVFGALERSGATILRQDYEGKRGFFVDRRSAERIVAYLESRGVVKLEGKICQ